MDTHEKLNSTIVYIRDVAVADLPEELRTQTEAETVYAIRDESGEQIALVDDRSLAFQMAIANDLSPVSVH